MRKPLIYAGLGVVIALAAVYTWQRVSAIAPEQADGFHVKCTRAECGWSFTIPRDQARTYPRDPDGKGFRCEKCGQFAAQLASRCDQCGEWYAVTEAVGRNSSCPKCDDPTLNADREGSVPR